jgi:putative nucleotidyltransferase with HDIG domain
MHLFEILQMNREKFKQIEKHIDSFPVLPTTVTRLLHVVSNPESSAQDVMETILPDQSLCLTILKFSNSVLFGRPKKIDSLTQAVAFLGFDEVQNIALSKSLINSFGDLEKKHLVYLDKFWEHSFMCGMAARHIAFDLKLRQDVAFTAGLIHDVGKLIILKSFEEDYLPQKWMTELSNEENLYNELQLFSCTHDIVGGQLLEKWLFPENLIIAVAYHHRPGSAFKEAKFAYIVQLADILSFYSCNPEKLSEESIMTCILKTLPEIEEKWLAAGLNFTDEAIENWYEWLLLNREEGNSIRDIVIP